MSFRSTPFGTSKPFQADPRITRESPQRSTSTPATPAQADTEGPVTAEDESDGPSDLTPEQQYEAAVAAAQAEAQAHWESKLASAVAEAEETAAVLAAGVAQLESLRAEVLKEAAEDIGAIVRLVSERVLDQSMAMHPDALKTIVSQALEQLPEAESVTIHVSPGQVEQITRAVDGRCRVQPDAEVGSGCIIRSRHVTLDSTLEAAMEGVDAAVRTWLTEQPWVSDWMLE